MSITIRLDTLELIAREINSCKNELQLVELMDRAGVPSVFITKPAKKYELVLNVLTNLSRSQENNHRQILFNLIALFAHPLTLNGSHTESRKMISKFNSWLKYDKLEMDWDESNLKIFMIPTIENEKWFKEIDQMDFDDLFSQINDVGIEKLRELVNGYRTMMDLVMQFFLQHHIPEDTQNSLYVRLIKLLETRVGEIFDPVNRIWEYKNLYLPSKNLFLLYSDLNNSSEEDLKKKTESILSGMNKYYGDISDLLLDIEMRSLPKSASGDLIKEVQAYVNRDSEREQGMPGNEMGIYKWGELTLNIGEAYIRYGVSEPLQISPEVKSIRLLTQLFEAKGEAVANVEIVKKLELTNVEESDTNTAFTEKVGFVRRDLVKLLRELGMPSDEIKKMIISVHKFGYKIGPQPKS